MLGVHGSKRGWSGYCGNVDRIGFPFSYYVRSGWMYEERRGWVVVVNVGRGVVVCSPGNRFNAGYGLLGVC